MKILTNLLHPCLIQPGANRRWIKNSRQLFYINIFSMQRINHAILPDFLTKQTNLLGHISLPQIGSFSKLSHAIQQLINGLKQALRPTLTRCPPDMKDATASFNDMRVRQSFRRAAGYLVVAGILAGSLPAQASLIPFEYDESLLGVQMIESAAEQSWIRLNQNRFSDVWVPNEQRIIARGAPTSGSPRAIIKAWSGFAYDTNRAKVTLWGGGHANYPGNEVYRWDFSTLNWERASLPTRVHSFPQYFNGAYYETIDGPHHSPIAAHTYDTNSFLANVDRFVVFGGPTFNSGRHFQDSSNGLKRTGPYFWDPNKADPNKVGGLDGTDALGIAVGGNMWQNRDNLDGPRSTFGKPGLFSPGWVNTAAATTIENGKDVVYIQAGTTLHRYIVSDANDPSSDEYQLVGWRSNTAVWNGQGAGAYSPDHHIFLRTAGFRGTPYWIVWDTSNPGTNRLISPTVVGGATFPFDELENYGIDYDPIRQRFVLWNGYDVWELTPPLTNFLSDDWELRQLLPSGQPDGPAGGVFNGVLGKWEYIPGLDVFLGLSDENDGNIWAYKPSDWTPSFSPTTASVPSASASDLMAPGLMLLYWMVFYSRRESYQAS